jgi:hypothetical protein
MNLATPTSMNKELLLIAASRGRGLALAERAC